MQKKIVKIIVKLALIFIAGMIVSVGMTVINDFFSMEQSIKEFCLLFTLYQV